MNELLLQKVLSAQIKAGKAVDISVTGISMEPALHQGDTVTVSACRDYAPGDILVYPYKGSLLVHRLLVRDGDLLFCKGDNAFRIEDIEAGREMGHAVAVNGRPLPRCPLRLIALSLAVGRAFRQCRYDVARTKDPAVYRLYEAVILKGERETMIYRKNESMEYIQADETSLAVFDPDSGNTHFFDETGIDILNCLAEPCDLDGLLHKLCGIYDATPEDIRADVEEFLEQTIEKGVVEVL